MSYFRAAILLVFVAIIGLAGYMMFLHDVDYETNKAFDEYMRGNNDGAAAILSKVRSDLSPAQYHLFMAYIDRAKNNPEQANNELKLALQGVKKTREPQGILVEIYLNQALNEYLLGNFEGMSQPLEEAEKAGGNKADWYAFLIALRENNKGNYEAALKEWQKNSTRNAYSPWMKKSFDDIFNTFWLMTNVARANIFEGHFLTARQKLESETKYFSGSKLDDLNMLIGLSYLREAEEKPVASAAPYYKLAFGYFNKVPMNSERYLSDRALILQQIEKQLNAMLDNGNVQDLSFFAAIMEKWSAFTELTKLNNLLLLQLNKQITDNNWKGMKEIATVLNRIVGDPEKRLQLKNRFEGYLKKSLAEGNLESTDKYWELARLFSNDPDELAKKIGGEAGADALALIPLDDENLFQTLPYLNLWQSINKDPQQRFAMAAQLLNLSIPIWVNDKQPEKALNMIKVASVLLNLNQKDDFQKLLSDNLAKMYETALKSNDLEILKGIVKTQNALNLSQLTIKEKEQANRDASEVIKLFEGKRYVDANKKALWILELDPGNQIVQRIAGLSNYILGDYQKALASLKSLRQPDDISGEALAVSEIIAGNAAQGENQLKQMMRKKAVQPEVFLRLGFGLLVQQQPEKSLEWLDQLPKNNPEAAAGKAYAYYALGDWKQAIDYYLQLPQAYRNINGMKSIVIESLLSLGLISEAEVVFQQVLTQNKSKQEGSYSQPFTVFKEIYLDPLSPDFIAGVYYKNILGNQQTAYEYFKKIQPPTPMILVEIGEILQARGKSKEARDMYSKALEESKNTPKQTEVKKRVLPSIAALDAQEGLYPESVEAFAEFYTLFPKEMAHRKEYAKSLEHIRRYDLALQQYHSLEQSQKLDDAVLISYISSMMHQGLFADARRAAMKRISQVPALKWPDQLALVEILTENADDEFSKMILKRLPEPQQRSLELNQALINLWIEQGNYPKANELALSLRQQLEKTSQGLLLLAKLNERQSNAKDAQKYTAMAQEKGSKDSAPGFLEPYLIELKELKQLAAEVQIKLDANPESITLRLNMAHILIDIAIETHLANPEIPVREVPELRRAYVIVDKMSEKITNIPGLYFLLGMSAFLLEDNPKAISSFQRAIELDPSYMDAYKYLAMVYGEINQNDKALALLKTALKFSPHDAEAWQDLAGVYQRTGNPIESLEAWQQAIHYRPNDADAYVEMAQVKLEVDNPEDAKSLLEKALKLSPNNVRALKLLLITLNDPLLGTDPAKKQEIQKQQEAAFKSLMAVDPKQAEALRAQLKSSTQ